MKRTVLVPALTVAAGLIAATAATPTAAQETGTFTILQAGNEIATESFTRTADRLETELEITGQAVIAARATLSPDATVDRLELRILPPDDPDADPFQSTAAEFRDDSVHYEQPIGNPAGVSTADDGTIPYVDPSPSFMEQILRRARALGGEQATVQIWMQAQGGPQVVPADVIFDGNDATLMLGNAMIEATTDGEGRLLSGEIPAQQVVIERQ